MTNTASTTYPSAHGITLDADLDRLFRIDGMMIKGLMPNHIWANAYMREFHARMTPLTLAASTLTAPLLEDHRGMLYLSRIER